MGLFWVPVTQSVTSANHRSVEWTHRKYCGDEVGYIFSVFVLLKIFLACIFLIFKIQNTFELCSKYSNNMEKLASAVMSV